MKIVITIAFLIIVVTAHCQTAIITKSEREIIPEGITINPVDKTIYVSSIGLMKIIAIDGAGAHRDFIMTGADGFMEGLGMKIDEKQQILWAVSNHREGKWYSSAVHAFDLKTGKVLQKYVMKDTLKHLFNDLILHPNEKIYITDTFAATVYEYDPAMKKFEVFIKSHMLTQANGIVCDLKGNLFVATYNGLMKIDLASKKLSQLKTQWMDGIAFWSNKIIGVSDAGVLQYELDATHDRVLSEKTIDSGNQYFHDPTTLAVSGDDLYLLATSYLSVYNENGESVKGVEEKLGPVVVLKYYLPNGK